MSEVSLDTEIPLDEELSDTVRDAIQHLEDEGMTSMAQAVAIVAFLSGVFSSHALSESVSHTPG